MSALRFEWNKQKNESNQLKHTVSFEEARSVFYDEKAFEFYDFDTKFSTDLLENLQLENKAIKKQEKDCETVASLKVIEYLHSHDGNPPWHLVAKTLGTSRTPFQCFQHAQTKLSNTLREMGNPIIFLQDDDELLFKFIAASGPQFVINNNTATLMAQKIFPKASPESR